MAQEVKSEIEVSSTAVAQDENVFGDDSKHEIKYHTLTWPFVAAIMITEVVGGTTFGLPQSLAVVGLVPGVIIIVFCGVWALFTSYLLIDFKMNHPSVHNMGDAGYILFSPFNIGWLGRELCSWGTVIFAVMGTGGLALLGAFALMTLDNDKHCFMLYTGIWSIAILVCAIPRTYDFGLKYLGLAGGVSIGVSCLVAMIGSGVEPTPNRVVDAVVPQNFVVAFLSISTPVINYAGHFMFFPLMSEMKRPLDAKKSAATLQIFATTVYTVFAVVSYCYLGSGVQSPSLFSLSDVWAKAAWGLALPNLLVSGAVFNNTAAKVLFVRLYRGTPHLTSHTFQGWSIWIFLLVICNGVGFLLAVGVPIFSFLAGLAAAAFASWFTYGLAGAFVWYDIYYLGSRKAYMDGTDTGHRGWSAIRRNLTLSLLAILTVLGGAFICVAGFYAIIKGIVEAYSTGQVAKAFTCGAGV